MYDIYYMNFKIFKDTFFPLQCSGDTGTKACIRSHSGET